MKNIASRISAFFVNYFSLSGQLVSQAEAEQNIREGVSFRGTNILILILAIFIASLGLNTNSTAVIIGAMLISPLMGPIIGIGLAIGVHDFDLLKRCLRNIIMAAGFSVIASTIYFLISPVNESHSELLARTSPTIYDVLIGFVGGGAGIIALGSTNKGNVIPGVAIATALMPPLCTAGYGIATWQLNYFFGATYLFIINSIYIAFATFIGVKLMKYKGITQTDDQRARRVRRIVYTLAILTMLPSIYLTYNMLNENKFVMNANRFVTNECRFDGTQVVSQKASIDHGQKMLTLTLIGKRLPADSLQLALTDKLQYYGLQGTHLTIYQGAEDNKTPTVDAMTTSGVSDIYRIAQNTITRQQSEIDSLRTIIRDDKTNLNAALAVTPELKIIFPNIKRVGISTTVFSSVVDDTVRVDTASVAMVTVGRNFSHEERRKFQEYIATRLGLDNVEVVEIK